MSESISNSDRMVEKIQAFAEMLEDPGSWTISVPVDDFDEVRDRLDTDESGLGSNYRGAALCYTNDHDEVWVRYSGPLDESPQMEGEGPKSDEELANDVIEAAKKAHSHGRRDHAGDDQ